MTHERSGSLEMTTIITISTLPPSITRLERLYLANTANECGHGDAKQRRSSGAGCTAAMPLLRVVTDDAAAADLSRAVSVRRDWVVGGVKSNENRHQAGKMYRSGWIARQTIFTPPNADGN